MISNNTLMTLKTVFSKFKISNNFKMLFSLIKLWINQTTSKITYLIWETKSNSKILNYHKTFSILIRKSNNFNKWLTQVQIDKHHLNMIYKKYLKIQLLKFDKKMDLLMFKSYLNKSNSLIKDLTLKSRIIQFLISRSLLNLKTKPFY